MNDPLENDIDTTPEHKICQPEPRKWLKNNMECGIRKSVKTF